MEGKGVVKKAAFYSSDGNKHVPIFNNSDYLSSLTKSKRVRKWKLIQVPRCDHSKWCSWIIDEEHYFLVLLLNCRVYCCGTDDEEMDFTTALQEGALELYEKIGEGPLSVDQLLKIATPIWRNGI